MTDRPRRRGQAALLLAGLLVTLLTSACSKPVAGSPAAAPGAEPTAESSTAEELPETSGGPVTPATVSPELEPLVGLWTGEYVCQQGKTGMHMAIQPSQDADNVMILFDFFPLPDNPGAKKGSYLMIGAYSGDTLQFKQQRWIDQPENYVMVDFEVTSKVESGMTTLSGTVASEGCESFTAKRA
jgi:hypothetical protein